MQDTPKIIHISHITQCCQDHHFFFFLCFFAFNEATPSHVFLSLLCFPHGQRYLVHTQFCFKITGENDKIPKKMVV
ncbi:hypothetical protein BJX96DRAFT_11764 [Aspergillus floccosus]